jgi:hypothetical protein
VLRRDRNQGHSDSSRAKRLHYSLILHLRLLLHEVFYLRLSGRQYVGPYRVWPLGMYACSCLRPVIGNWLQTNLPRSWIALSNGNPQYTHFDCEGSLAQSGILTHHRNWALQAWPCQTNGVVMPRVSRPSHRYRVQPWPNKLLLGSHQKHSIHILCCWWCSARHNFLGYIKDLI